MQDTLSRLLEQHVATSHLSHEQCCDLAAAIVMSINSEFIKKQTSEIRRIEIEKWKEGERINRDPGKEFVLNWIKTYGEEFNDKFYKSDCRTCAKVLNCPNVPMQHCNQYQTELLEQSRHVADKILNLLEEKGILGPQQKTVVEEIRKRYGVAD
jgi:hypothetical protein